MATVELNKKVPNFTLPATSGDTITLGQLQGYNVVLYFYPKDNTPGCTQEGIDFGALASQFSKAETMIIGVSRDSIVSHEKFKCEYHFPFELISDAESVLCKQFDVIKEKNMYGKKVLGIERSTFLIDKKGVLRFEWRKVKVPGHAEAVLEQVKALNRG